MENLYHIYNRGAHKATIFGDHLDYWRFLSLMYIGNSTEPFQLSNYSGKNIFSLNRKKTLVNISAYCLMPNHFHIALEECAPDGISRFIQKICTGYAMYYNIKYKHSGTIFQGAYKAKPVTDEEYSRVLINYIHLNPFGIEEPNVTKEYKSEHLLEAIECSRKYEYSSFKYYLGEIRTQDSILRSDLDISRSDLTYPQPSPLPHYN
jgi:putative transposase